MPAKLTTIVSKIPQVPNKTNSAIIEEFYTYLKAKGSSEQHQNNILKTVIAYGIWEHTGFSQYLFIILP